MSQTTIVVAETTPAAPAAEGAAAETPAAGETGHTTEGTAAEGGHGRLPADGHVDVPVANLLARDLLRAALPADEQGGAAEDGCVLAKRSSAIEGDLSRAQALKEETEAAIAAYEKALADARAKAQDIAVETRNA